jgi:hypothetical protein
MSLEISTFDLARLPIAVALSANAYEGSAQDDRGFWWDVGRSGKERVRVYSGTMAQRSPNVARGVRRGAQGGPSLLTSSMTALLLAPGPLRR